MGSFGDKLKRERELRGVTIEEIAEATKIGTRSLKALEDEHFDQLPGGIFNKGFVRAYARFLGLDEEQAVADYVAAQGQDSASKDVMAQLAAKAEVSRRSDLAASGGEKKTSSNSIWITAAILVLLTAGAAAGIRYYKQKHAAAAQAAAQPRVEVPAQAQTAPPPTAADGTMPSSATAQTTDPNVAAMTATATPTSIPSSAGASLTPTTPTQTAPATTQPATSSAAASTATAKPVDPKTADSGAHGAIELQIHVARATWLSVQTDGKAPTTETLRDSATKTVIAQDRVVITTGNAIDLTCNGKPLGLLGADNKRSQLRITSDCKVN